MGMPTPTFKPLQAAMPMMPSAMPTMASPFAASPFGTPFASPFGMPGMPGMPMMFPPQFAPQPAVVGYRPVILNGPTGGDAFNKFIPEQHGTTGPLPESAQSAAAPAEAAAPVDPAAPTDPAVADPAAATDPAAAAATKTGAAAGKPAAPGAPVSYEDELGDRVTSILKRNPQLTTRVKQWETDIEAKGLDLETLAENPDQMVQELIANPNSIVNEKINTFKQTKRFKVMHRIYKMVPGPIRKLMIKLLPNKYEAMAEQTLDNIFEKPATPTPGSKSSPSSSGPDSLGGGDTHSPAGGGKSIDDILGSADGPADSGPGSSSLGDIGSDIGADLGGGLDALSGGPSGAKGLKEPAL